MFKGELLHTWFDYYGKFNYLDRSRNLTHNILEVANPLAFATYNNLFTKIRRIAEIIYTITPFKDKKAKAIGKDWWPTGNFNIDLVESEVTLDNKITAWEQDLANNEQKG